MKPICLHNCLVMSAMLLTTIVAFAQTPASAPVPAALLSAKAVFISNAGSDSGLFPEPFSGDANRPYSEFYSALKATGDYTLVADPAQADLVLELRLTAPYGPTNPNKQNGTSDPLPMFRLVVYDRPTHYILWTATQSVEVAYLQKTHDRNFDLALSALLNQFLVAAGKPPATPSSAPANH